MSLQSAKNGQSNYDKCIEIYGDLNFMIKLMNDSGVSNLSVPVKNYTYNPGLININNNFIGYSYATEAKTIGDSSRGFDTGFSDGFS